MERLSARKRAQRVTGHEPSQPPHSNWSIRGAPAVPPIDRPTASLALFPASHATRAEGDALPLRLPLRVRYLVVARRDQRVTGIEPV